MSYTPLNFDLKKGSDQIYFSNSSKRSSLQIGVEKVKAPLIQLSAINSKPTIRKQDSLISLMSPTSNYDESPQSRQKQIMQIEQHKAQNKEKMIEDFKHFIMKQKKNNDSQINLFSINKSSSSIIFGNPSVQTLKNQNSFKLGDIPENDSFIFPKEDLNTQQSGQSQNTTTKPKLNRQASIAQAIQKKLKIVHKSKEQLFNEKLQLFKGVSTYIETKSYLQNLNLLNQKNMIESMKKNQQWTKELDEFKKRQDFLEKSKLTDNLKEDEHRNSDEEEDEDNLKIMKEDQNKFDASNPQFDKNVNLLLDKAHKHVKEMKVKRIVRQNKSMNDLDSHNLSRFFQFVSSQVFQNNIIDTNDENQFYDDLKTVLQENKKKQLQKQEEKEVQEVLMDQQQKRYELELLNQIYSNPAFSDQLSPQKLQEFINLQIKQKFSPEQVNQDQNAKNKLLGGKNLDISANLDAKSQYQDYVEKATHIRKTLLRLNENLFKQKWANAQMKRKKEKEQLRNSIIRKIQNNEIEYNKIDALFPSKRKMKHIKSKVNSNIEHNADGYMVRSNSIESTSPTNTDKKFFNPQVGPHNLQSNQALNINNPSLHSSNDLTVNEGTKVGLSTRNDLTTIPNSLRYIEMKDSARQNNQQSYLYQTPSGYIRQVTKVDLTEEERAKKQEIFERQSIKKQQEQLKKNILQNITHFQAKKSSAPSLLTTGFPQIKSVSHFHSPSQSSHMIKSSYNSPFKKGENLKQKAKNQQYFMSNNSKVSTIMGSTTLKEISSSVSTPMKFKATSFNKFMNSNQPASSTKHFSQHSAYLSPPKQLQKEKYTYTVNNLSNQNLDPTFDVSAQKCQVISLITNLESEKNIRRKDRKDFEKQISEIQINCTQDLNKIKGVQISSMKNLLDVDFLKFSMRSRQNIRDTNIKNFLNQYN